MIVYLKYNQDPNKEEWIKNLRHDTPYIVKDIKDVGTQEPEYELEGHHSYFLTIRFLTEKEYKSLQFNNKLEKELV